MKEQKDYVTTLHKILMKITSIRTKNQYSKKESHYLIQPIFD